MCGIMGIVDYEGEVDPRRVRRMSNALVHRGPDGEGYWTGEHVALGHRRLAIVDVEGGRQPTTNEDGTIVVVFNGEIYNHRELRRKLAARGHRFLSHSDTEVIPHLYEERGLSFVEELDGDFAIALWDSVREVLVLTRDRVGVKPLFYHAKDRRLAFASEVKGVLASGLCKISVDRQGLSDCLVYGQPVAPGTFWEGVEDLPPGTIARWGRGGLTIRRYYSPMQRVDPDRPLRSGRAAIADFARTFTEAVRKRLPDEVRAGACLSGGLDSTAVVGVAARSLGTPMDTWSIRLPGEPLDEGAYSRHAAAALGVKNHELALSGHETAALLKRSIWHLETPQWFGVAPPFLALSQGAREAGVKVALTGDGADELLGGYDFYRLQDLNRRLGSYGLGWLAPPLLRRALAWIGTPAGAVDQILRVNGQSAELRRRHGEVPAWSYLWSGMAPLASQMVRNGELPPPSVLPAPPAHDALRRSLFFEYVTRLPNWVLVLSDRLSMANGVEVRVPFMDRDLLDLSTELAPGMLLHRGVEKYVLKEAVRDQVPALIRRRRKKPFFTPIASWYLDGPGRDLAGDYLSAGCVRRHGLFDPATVQSLWSQAVGAPGTWHAMLAEWACMSVMSTHMLVEQFTPANLIGSPTEDTIPVLS